MSTIVKLGLAVLPVMVLTYAGPSRAAANLVTNGDFSQVTYTSGSGSEQIAYGGTSKGAVLTDWANSGYAFLLRPGSGTSGTTADTSGAHSTQYNNTLRLWGPGDGSANGLTNDPTHGNFVAEDGNYSVGPLTQTINGLTANQTYVLTFDWASAQQFDFSGATTEGWTVGLGGQTFSTPTVQTANHGFDGWFTQAFTFKATSSSEVLSFLAFGSPPSGSPPFSLLSNISLVVPEPSTWAVMGVGLGVLALFSTVRRRRGRTGV